MDANTTISAAKAVKNIFEPNKMTYFDTEGVQHEIHMPKGTFKTACDYLMAGNFEELAKFPAWGTSRRQLISLSLYWR